MDSKIVHHHEEHFEGDNQDEDHYEKKSVLKKVKAKAKKFKDTITGHHVQGHDHDHVPGDHDLDGEDSEEEDSPEAHGAPIHDSAVITNTGLPRQEHNSPTPAATVEDTKAARDDPIAPRDHVPGQNQSTGHVRREDLKLGPKPNFSGPTTGSVLPVPGLGEEIAGQPKVISGKTSVLGEGPHAPQNTPVPSLTHGNYKTTKDTEPRPTFVSGQGGHDIEQSRVNVERPRGLGKDPNAPRANPQAHTPSNYEAKVTDPTSEGGEEVGITPILHSFDKMNLHGGEEHKPHDQVPSLSTGSHDQFSHGPHGSTATERPSKQSTTYTDKSSSATPAIADKATSAKNVVASKLGYGGESDQKHNQVSNLSTGSRDQFSQGLHDSTATERPSKQSSTYTDKSSSAIADKAASAKNIVASELGYGGESDQKHNQVSNLSTGSHDPFSQGPHGSTATERPSKQNTTYTDKSSSAIADKAASAKNIVASELGYGGESDQKHNQVSNLSTGSHDQSSQGPHDTEKPSNQSTSYAGKNSSATSAIAGTAVSAKNVVASKLGYGGNVQDREEYPKEHDQSGDHVRVGGTVNSGSSTPDQQKQSSSYTEKISFATSAIADKAISAKNAVASKLGYGGTGQDHDQVHDQSGDVSHVRSCSNSAPDQQGQTIGASFTEKSIPVHEKVGGAGSTVVSKIKGSSPTSTSGVNRGGEDKGVTVKDYFAEKLRPGEEDKALSEVISGALHNRKAYEPEEPVEAASYKAEYSAKPVGKVTESEEVKNRLGKTEGNENFVVDRIKGVVGSWFGKSGEQQEEVGGETEPNRSHVAEESKPQKSGN